MKRLKKIIESFCLMVIMWISKVHATELLYGIPAPSEKDINNRVEELKILNKIDLFKNLLLPIVLLIMGFGVLINKTLKKKYKIIIIFMLIIIGIIGIYFTNNYIDSTNIERKLYEYKIIDTNYFEDSEKQSESYRNSVDKKANKRYEKLK